MKWKIACGTLLGFLLVSVCTSAEPLHLQVEIDAPEPVIGAHQECDVQARVVNRGSMPASFEVSPNPPFYGLNWMVDHPGLLVKQAPAVTVNVVRDRTILLNPGEVFQDHVTVVMKRPVEGHAVSFQFKLGFTPRVNAERFTPWEKASRYKDANHPVFWSNRIVVKVRSM